MNDRDTMPACARIAEVSPDLADRMWNTVTDPDGRDLIDERMRAKGRVLCAACPMRLDCISRALVNGWKDKAVYGGLDHPDWAERMCRDGRDYWRRAKRRQRSRREYTHDDPLFLPTEPVPKGLVQGSLF